MHYWWLIVIFVILTIVLILLGSAWHNLWLWTNRDNLIAAFAPVNESFWEHTKLLTYPLLIFALLLYAIVGDKLNNKGVGLFLATFVGFLVMVVIFYAYTGGNLDNSVLWVDIMLYVIAFIIAMFVLYVAITSDSWGMSVEYIGIALYVVWILLTILWSYDPPCDCSMWKKYNGH
jgi:hypothetical protein